MRCIRINCRVERMKPDKERGIEREGEISRNNYRVTARQCLQGMSSAIPDQSFSTCALKNKAWQVVLSILSQSLLERIRGLQVLLQAHLVGIAWGKGCDPGDNRSLISGPPKRRKQSRVLAV